MAYTKVITLKSSLNKAVAYVLNKEKTDLKSAIDYAMNKDKNTHETNYLENSINCKVDTAFTEMKKTKDIWNKKGGNLGYHIIQSFAPNEIDAETAHKIGMEFAQRCFGDKYQVIVSTHLDKNHLHNHVVINSVSFVDGKKYKSDFKSYYGGIRKNSDDICMEYGLSIIPDIKDKKSLSYIDWLDIQKSKGSYKNKIMADIDHAIIESFSYGEFLMTMEEMGYEIKDGKYIAFKYPGKDRFARGYKLGNRYSEDAIRARIENSPLPPLDAYTQPVYTSLQWQKSKFMPDIERKYWRWMYQLGLVQKRQAPPKMTKELKGELDKLERYKRQQKFLTTHSLSDEREFFEFIENLYNTISDLKDKLYDFESIRKQNKQLYDSLRDLKLYAKAHEMYLQGYEAMADESEKYLLAVNYLNSNEFYTDADLQALSNEKANVLNQISVIKKDIRYYQSEKRTCNDIIKTMEYMDVKTKQIDGIQYEKERDIDDTRKR